LTDFEQGGDGGEEEERERERWDWCGCGPGGSSGNGDVGFHATRGAMVVDEPGGRRGRSAIRRRGGLDLNLDLNHCPLPT